MSDIRSRKPARARRDSKNPSPRREESPNVANEQRRPIAPTDPSSMPRADDHPGGVEGSSDFHDRPGQGNGVSEE